MKEKKSTQISRFCFFIFLLSYPLSVTISQAAFAISCAFFLLDTFRSRDNLNFFQVFPPAFWIAIGIYISILLTSLSIEFGRNGFDGPFLTLNFWKGFTQGETSDFWMTLGIPLGIYHLKNENHRSRVILFTIVGIVLNILTGFISIFTPFRLARWIQLGFTYPEGERLQHFAGSILEIGTYLPIGFQATHLTYGGLLGLTFPGLVFSLFVFRSKIYEWFAKRLMPTSIFIPKLVFWIGFNIIICLGSIVLLTNQSRSVWIGIIILIFVIALGLIIQKKFKGIQVLKIFSILLIIGIGLGFIGKKFYDSNWLFQRAIQDITQKVSTENQRYFILKNTFEILSKNWLLGVGNNRFQKSWIDESNKIIAEREWLWYEMEITPKSHSHHDFLHFWTVGGLPAGILFVFLWSLIWARLYNLISIMRFFTNPFKVLPDGLFLGIGILTIFPAGFFQCYLLDDEVALPFYMFMGFFFTPIGRVQSASSIRFSIYGILTVLSMLIVSVGFWKYRTSLPIDEVHTKKKSLQIISDTLQVMKLEGCLSHRFLPDSHTYPPREKDFSIQLQFTKRNQRMLVHPYKINVQLIDRDSFDQDKLYKAHSSRMIAERTLLQNKNWEREIDLDFSEGLIDSPSDGYPGIIRFRDFRLEFYFQEGTINPILPTIQLERMCGINKN